MTAQFLRDEAARFRGMAKDTDREATRLRFLAMAADYEARAGIEHALSEPNTNEVANELAGRDVEGPTIEQTAPDRAETLAGNSGGKVTSVPKASGAVRPRPVGRPRRVTIDADRFR
jgi:hypothetical protein